MIQTAQRIYVIANILVNFGLSLLKGGKILVFCFPVVTFILHFCQFTIVLKDCLYLNIWKGIKLLHLVEVQGLDSVDLCVDLLDHYFGFVV
jgi:hypothetical protein